MRQRVYSSESSPVGVDSRRTEIPELPKQQRRLSPQYYFEGTLSQTKQSHLDKQRPPLWFLRGVRDRVCSGNAARNLWNESSRCRLQGPWVKSPPTPLFDLDERRTWSVLVELFNAD